MNNEIKEILDSMKKHLQEHKEDYQKIVVESGFPGDSITYELYYDEVKTIVDYITNLQEENKRLVELCNKYEEEHNTAFNLWKMKMEEMPTYEEKENYKSRIDKAIEYLGIDEDILKTCEIYDVNGIEVYKILQGSGKE